MSLTPSMTQVKNLKIFFQGQGGGAEPQAQKNANICLSVFDFGPCCFYLSFFIFHLVVGSVNVPRQAVGALKLEFLSV